MLGATVEEGMGRGGLEGEEVEEKGDAECFDDGDFYQQILRDVVESRMLDLGTFLALFSSSSFSLRPRRRIRPPDPSSTNQRTNESFLSQMIRH